MRLWILGSTAILMMVHPWAAQEPLGLVHMIGLPRVDGRIDHLAFDPGTGRLYVAALGHDTVEVLDTKQGTHIRSLTGFHEPQGIAIATAAKAVAVANGAGDGVQMMSGDDYRLGAMIRLGNDADNIRYDTAASRLYVGYGSGALARSIHRRQRSSVK